MKEFRRLRWMGLVSGVALIALGAGGCKKGSDQQTAQPVRFSLFGTNGCNGANNVFVTPETVLDNSVAVGAMGAGTIGSMSQIAASSTSDTLYLTGADATVWELDFSADPKSPTLTQLVGPGVIDNLLAGVFSPAPPAVLSGIAVLDPSNLVVVEHTSHTILIVSILNPDSVGFYVGFPSLNAGFSDGIGGASRFGFLPDVPAQLAVTGDLRVVIPDAGNHAIRQAQLGAVIEVLTIGGNGVPFHADGALQTTGFDTPVSVNVACSGDVLVTEIGPEGNRLRALTLGGEAFFGGVIGASLTVLGDGTNSTTGGDPTTATMAEPMGLASTMEGEVYWMDSSTGILRRFSIVSGDADCPLFGSCFAAGTAGGSFSQAGNYSVAISSSGYLYVLDGSASAIAIVSDTP